MAIAVLQTTAKQTGDSVTSKNFAFNGITAGSTIIVPVSVYMTSIAVSEIEVSDGDGKYTKDADIQVVQPNGVLIFRLINASAGNHSITVDFKGISTYVTCSGIEVGTELLLDSNSYNVGSSTTPSSGAARTTSVADEFIVGVMSIQAAQASITVEVTAPTWTELYEELSFSHATGEANYKIVSSAAAYTANWTAITSTAWTAAICTYTESGGATPGGGEFSSVF